MLTPYFELRRSIGSAEDIQRLADFVHLPNLKLVEDESVVAQQLLEIRRYLLSLKATVQRFEQQKGIGDGNGEQVVGGCYGRNESRQAVPRFSDFS